MTSLIYVAGVVARCVNSARRWWRGPVPCAREEARSLDLWQVGGDGVSIEDFYFELALD